MKYRMLADGSCWKPVPDKSFAEAQKAGRLAAYEVEITARRPARWRNLLLKNKLYAFGLFADLNATILAVNAFQEGCCRQPSPVIITTRYESRNYRC